MQEIWKDIKGYEGKYQVSNTGKVKSLNYMRKGQPKELKKTVTSKKKYGCVKLLDKDYKEKKISVARLVAETFIPNPNNYKYVRHISENCLDDSVENIMWCEMSDYIQKLYNQKRIVNTRDYSIVYKGKKYKNQKELAKDYGLKVRCYLRRLQVGWTQEKALETPLKKSSLFATSVAKKHEFYGEKLTIKELCEKNGISEKTLRSRLDRGWNIYEASEIPVAIFKGGKKE